MEKAWKTDPTRWDTVTMGVAKAQGSCRSRYAKCLNICPSGFRL